MNDRNTEVLEQYDLEAVSLRRGRGAWVCETDQGIKLLREYKGTMKRLEFEEEVLGLLKESGGLRVDQYVRNREGGLLSAAGDGSRYILKDWYMDREYNVRDEEEMAQAVVQIAGLHKQLRRVEVKEEWNLGSILAEPMETEMERHNREGLPEHFLCHGELNQHHLLMGPGYTAVIEFNRMHLGVQTADLYHFIRKALEKHGWNLRLGMKMLDSYDRVLPMGKKEREYLYYLFLYPEKYWKQLNFYHNANKAWIPARNVEKLRNLEAQQKEREAFLKQIRS